MASQLQFEQLDSMIRTLRTMGDVGTQVAPAVARAFDAELHAQIRRGQGPNGEAWPKNQDGSTPLQTADVSVRAVGSSVVATLSGPAVLHHEGRARGRIRRQILPSSRIPDPVIRAIHVVLRDAFARRAGGA